MFGNWRINNNDMISNLIYIQRPWATLTSQADQWLSRLGVLEKYGHFCSGDSTSQFILLFALNNVRKRIIAAKKAFTNICSKSTMQFNELKERSMNFSKNSRKDIYSHIE